MATYADSPAELDNAVDPEGTLRQQIGQLITQAEQYIDGELSPMRAKATEYYKGDAYGNEEAGRSQFVTTDLRDAVDGAVPQIVRVVFGPERPVEFTPDRPETQEIARQATEYVYTIFAEQNAGFLRSLDVIKDGLVRGLGIFKVYYDDSQVYRAGHDTSLTEEQVAILAQDPDVMQVQPSEAGTIPGIDPQSGQLVMVPVYDVEYMRRQGKGRIVVEGVPPEEFLFGSTARSVEDAMYVGHRREPTVGELVSMGYDREVIEDQAGSSSRLADNPERVARQINETTFPDEYSNTPLNKRVPYVESYAWLDRDGIYARRKVCTLGAGYTVLHTSIADELPFAVFSPYPEPHTMMGQSMYDRIGPKQKAKSSVARATLDSLSAAIFSRTAYDLNKVSTEDILNTDVGAPIRCDGPPNQLVFPFNHAFVGQYAMPFIEWFDDAIERSTGQSKGAQGLDMDALQSTEKGGVQAAVSASAAQTELLARVFCEGTLKPLFRKILALLIQHPDAAGPVRVNGQWLFVDPRSWNLDWDVTVNVGIGSGSTERKLATLGAIAEQQKELIANMGPDNPMTDVSRYRNTLERLSTLAGYPDGAQFWKTPQESQQVIEAMQQQPPQPSPEMILAQNEVQKAEAQAQAKQVELQMKAAESQQNVQIEQMKMETSLQVEREKLAADIMMQREKLAAETQLAEQELALKYAAEDAKAERDTNATATQQSQASQPGIHLMLPDSIGGAVGTPMQMMAEHQTMMGEQQMQAMAEIVAGMQQTVAQLAQVAQSIAAVASTLSQPQVLVQQPEKANPVNLRIERDADGKMSGVRGVA